MIALKRANEVRVARAKLKQELREGNVRIEQVLARPPEHVSTAKCSTCSWRYQRSDR